jgi:hypothetical protein
MGTSSAFASATVFSKDGLLRPVSILLRYFVSIPTFSASDVRERRYCADAGGIGRMLFAGGPRDARRSHGRAAVRIATHLTLIGWID